MDQRGKTRRAIVGSVATRDEVMTEDYRRPLIPRSPRHLRRATARRAGCPTGRAGDGEKSALRDLLREAIPCFDRTADHAHRNGALEILGRREAVPEDDFRPRPEILERHRL